MPLVYLHARVWLLRMSLLWAQDPDKLVIKVPKNRCAYGRLESLLSCSLNHRLRSAVSQLQQLRINV